MPLKNRIAKYAGIMVFCMILSVYLTLRVCPECADTAEGCADLGTLDYLKTCLGSKFRAILFDGIVWSGVILGIHWMWSRGRTESAGQSPSETTPAAENEDAAPEVEREPEPAEQDEEAEPEAEADSGEPEPAEQDEEAEPEAEADSGEPEPAEQDEEVTSNPDSDSDDSEEKKPSDHDT